MTLDNLIEGLTTFRKYFNKDGYATGAEHDQLFVYSTDKPMASEDVIKVRRLGWFQPDARGESDGETASDEELAKEYDAEEGWSCFT